MTENIPRNPLSDESSAVAIELENVKVELVKLRKKYEAATSREMRSDLWTVIDHMEWRLAHKRD